VVLVEPVVLDGLDQSQIVCGMALEAVMEKKDKIKGRRSRNNSGMTGKERPKHWKYQIKIL